MREYQSDNEPEISGTTYLRTYERTPPALCLGTRVPRQKFPTLNTSYSTYATYSLPVGSG